jgi:ABC-type tungstate transport system substrate-binding protein
MFRSVYRSSSGVVNVPRAITTCKIFCCAYPVVWLYVSVYVYLLRTGPCGVWICTFTFNNVMVVIGSVYRMNLYVVIGTLDG